jgi:endonuclease/exonuclease/phosphatase family metal-dependent hydrolase
MLRRRLFSGLAAVTIGLSLMTPAAEAAPSPTNGARPAAEAKATAKRTVVRVATYNVRTARAKHGGSWLNRAPAVAREILSRRPGVVLLQELGPGRADGSKGKINGAARQTTSLLSQLGKRGGREYRMVRTTSYVAPGSKHGTQGARILYDSSRYRLLSRCPETTGKRNYNPSCAFDLPLAAGDSRKKLRAAAYAKFQDRRTGRQFWVVSAHLDNRHSKSGKTEAKYNRLRARQAAYVAQRLARLNTQRLPVVFGGDINSWLTDRGRYAPHRALVARGYRDAVAAKTRINVLYPTVNHWKTTLRKTKRGVRLDVIMVRGARGFLRYENKMARVDRSRPSDHNMVLADVRL